MVNPFLRPVVAAMLLGLIASSGTVAHAGNFGSNMNTRVSIQNFPQTGYAGEGRSLNVGYGTPSTAPPPSYGQPGSRVHDFNASTQFDGKTGDVSTHGKLPK